MAWSSSNTTHDERHGGLAKDSFAVMAAVHAGPDSRWTFIDYSGKRPSLVDRRTGELRRVELFVAVLGASARDRDPRERAILRHASRFGAMADAVQQQLQSGEAATLGFEERFGLLVDAEWTAREQRKLQRRLQTAKLRHPATLEAVDFTPARRLNRQQVLTLGTCAWLAERHNLIVTGPCGIGKSFLCCAFVERACRRGFTARYVRMPRLLHEVAVGRGDGSYTRLMARLAKLDLLAIDDWMLAPLRDAERRDLTEVIEDRAERASTLIASQLPVTDWHAVIGDPNQADAICDRLLHDAHRIELKGRSMRRTHDAPNNRPKETT